MKLYTIPTGYFKLDGGAMFGVVPKTIWQKINPPDANNLCTWAMRCLLVEHENRLVLIDTGLGNKQSEKFFSYYEPHGEDSLLGSLKKLGFTPNDITDVFLTHLHFDHCGGAVIRMNDEKLVPQFPHAVYWTNKAHWQHAITPNAREKASFLKENFMPLEAAGQLQFLEEGQSLFDGFSFTSVFGHTEAMMLPVIEYQARKVIYCADLLPSAGHLPVPYVMAYDIRPLDSLQEKASFLAKAQADDAILFFEHDPNIACCTLQATEKGIRIRDTFGLEEMFS
ncbi:MAG: MBL fold metallo-hydrolase [Chitinophagales bacterium]|nr:MBL fold metallo-hydrolase [Bacteroidota bacterium]MCB9042586.1 MBL fold metallo-hydrolase [Chitinophagales bacterium]